MVAIAYLIPVLFCLILGFGFDYHGKASVFILMLLSGEVFVGILHILFYRLQTISTEYLGSLVKSVHHEEAWTELVPRTVTRRDSRGNTYTTVQTVEQRHPEQFYFHTTRGSRIETDRDFFAYVLGQWMLPPIPDTWTGSRIKGGARYGSHRNMDFFMGCPISDDPRWVSVTEKHRYKNKIRNSNSIFKFRKVTDKEAERLNLFEYPKIKGHDVPCIMSQSFPVPLLIQKKFQRFNGAFAPLRQMRLFILIFDSSVSTAAVSEFQRAYWQGGNKNEIVICLGVDHAGHVEWARTFSWAAVQQLEAEAAGWFMRHPELDLDVFHDWLLTNYGVWERRHFSDFRYIHVQLPGRQLLTIIALSVLENVCALAVIFQ